MIYHLQHGCILVIMAHGWAFVSVSAYLVFKHFHFSVKTYLKIRFFLVFFKTVVDWCNNFFTDAWVIYVRVDEV